MNNGGRFPGSRPRPTSLRSSRSARPFVAPLPDKRPERGSGVSEALGARCYRWAARRPRRAFGARGLLIKNSGGHPRRPRAWAAPLRTLLCLAGAPSPHVAALVSLCEALSRAGRGRRLRGVGSAVLQMGGQTAASRLRRSRSLNQEFRGTPPAPPRMGCAPTNPALAWQVRPHPTSLRSSRFARPSPERGEGEAGVGAAWLKQGQPTILRSALRVRLGAIRVTPRYSPSSSPGSSSDSMPRRARRARS